MKIVALVQARMGSTRLPNKVMKPVNGVPMIELLLSRLSRAKEVSQIVVATSVDERNRPLVEHVRKLGYACEQGSEMMCWTALCKRRGCIRPMWSCVSPATVRW